MSILLGHGHYSDAESTTRHVYVHGVGCNDYGNSSSDDNYSRRLSANQLNTERELAKISETLMWMKAIMINSRKNKQKSNVGYYKKYVNKLLDFTPKLNFS